jgi:hypothetical protein
VARKKSIFVFFLVKKINNDERHDHYFMRENEMFEKKDPIEIFKRVKKITSIQRIEAFSLSMLFQLHSCKRENIQKWGGGEEIF